MIDTAARTLTRRRFLLAAATAATGLRGTTAAATTQKDAEGFFTIGQKGGQWWFLTPDDRQPFFSLGLNHMDPASLRYPENTHIWREQYGGSALRWIRESVAPNLDSWGFNTVGWVQEVTVRQWRHSRPFTVDEYRALEMPFCHLIPFTESHQWEKHTIHFDFRSAEWAEWADYVARSHCGALRKERNLIGYFYSDCPTWTHDRPQNEWRGPIFDPDLLETAAGRRELTELARTYYQTTHDAIRRYDPHHLLLGDRYEANAPIAEQVVQTAVPLVDVLSFQDFRDPIRHLEHWHQSTDKPVLLADSARVRRTPSESGFVPNDGEWYQEIVDALFTQPGCMGVHLCGAYQRNKARRRGLLDEMENPDSEHVDRIRATNQRVAQQLAAQF